MASSGAISASKFWVTILLPFLLAVRSIPENLSMDSKYTEKARHKGFHKGGSLINCAVFSTLARRIRNWGTSPYDARFQILILIHRKGTGGGLVNCAVFSTLARRIRNWGTSSYDVRFLILILIHRKGTGGGLVNCAVFRTLARRVRNWNTSLSQFKVFDWKINM